MPVPTPTPLDPTARYIGAGTRRFVFTSTIADYTNPYSSELSGTDLTSQIKPDGVEGFQVESDVVEAGDYGVRYGSRVSGLTSTGDSALTFYANRNGVNQVAALLPIGTSGYIVDFFAGITSGARMNVFPVQVMESSATQEGAGETVGWRIQFAAVGVPAENIPVPTQNGPSLVVTDNGDGTATSSGSAVTDNGDGTTTFTSGATDNGDGTATLGAAA